MELLSFAHARLAAAILGSGTLLTLRVVLSTTSLLSSEGTTVATDPEEPDDYDRRTWLLSPSDGANEVVCTSAGDPWRFAMGAMQYEVEATRPAWVPAAGWARAMIETAKRGHGEWLASPRSRPFAFLVSDRSTEAITLSLARVHYDKQRARLRTVWRAERPITARDLDARVAAVIERTEQQPPLADLERRTKSFSRDMVLYRTIADDVETLEGGGERQDTVSLPGAVAVIAPSALPFQHAPSSTRLVAAEAPPSTRESALPPTPFYEERLSLGQRLAGPVSPSRLPPPPEPAPPVTAAQPSEAAGSLVVSWAADDAVKRMRRQRDLRELLPRVRRAEGVDGEGSDERTRRELARTLERAQAGDPSAVTLELASDEEEGPYGKLLVLRGQLAPEYDEIATLRATVGAVVTVRRGSPKVEEAAAAAEQLLEAGTLEEAPGVARDAANRILDSVRQAREDAVATVRDTALASLVRGRKYATRPLEGETYVRAAFEGVVTYLPAGAAEKLPLLRSMAAVVVASAGAAMEEGDPSPVLWVHVLARDIRA